MTATNIYEMAQEWNNGAVDFTAIEMDVTDTASGVNSKLLDLQVGGASQFSVSKSGGITNKYLLATGATIGAAFAIGGAGTNQYALHCGDANSATADFLFWSPGSPATMVSYRTGSTSKVSLNSSGVKLANDASLRWGASHAGRDSLSANALILTKDAADILAQRNGVNAQAFNIYNTYTDGSNYERGFMRWNANVLEIGTEAAGTGIARSLALKLAGVGGARNVLSVAPMGGYDVELSTPIQLRLRSDNVVLYPNADITFMFDGNRSIRVKPSTNTITSVFFGKDFAIEGPHRDVDEPIYSLVLRGGNAKAAALTNLTGGGVQVVGGAGAADSLGNAHGGNVTIAGGTGYGTGHDGYVILSNLPTSDPTEAGAIWNDAGTLKVSAG